METPEIDYFPEIEEEADLYLPLRHLLMLKFGTQDVEITDKKREEKHSCDLILGIPHVCKIGFQVKRTKFTKTTLDGEFKDAIRDAADFEVFGDIKTLSQFFWITTNSVDPTIPQSAYDDIAKKLRFSKVEVWNGKELYDNFVKYYPDAFTNVKIDSLSRKADQQSERGNSNSIFAAHYLFSGLRPPTIAVKY